MKPLYALAVALTGLSLSCQVFAADFKFGYVKIERIYSESQAALNAQKSLEKEFSGREKELKKLADQANKLQKQLSQVKDEDDKKPLERQLAALEREYQAKFHDFREDLNQRRNEEFASVQERANRIVKKIAEDGHYDLILQDAVYVDPKYDITPQVLKGLEN